MDNGPRKFRVNLATKEIQKADFDALGLKKVDFDALGLKEVDDIQEWIAKNPSILGDDLLIIGKEFSDFDRTDERVDLVAVDREGKLVVIELKRDCSDKNVHGQAIKYASYLSDATQEEIVSMLANHKPISESDAEAKLREHIKPNDLSTLNHDQRIILASHGFAPQVKSAVLWLNERAPGKNLITCIQLTPYQQDGEIDSLYLKASPIIPGSVNNDCRIRIYQDENTDFLRKVGRLATDCLPDEIQPNKTSQRAMYWESIAYYDFFYSLQPWNMDGGWGTYYRVHLEPEKGTDTRRKANVTFKHKPRDMNVNFDLQAILNRIAPLPHRWKVDDGLRRILVEVGSGTFDDDDFARKIADVLRKLIETITPIVDDLANKSNGET